MNKLPEIDKTWTLFLDRDGVINYEKKDDYIHSWAEFSFYPNAARAVAALSRLFGLTIVVTNQKGIGRGLTKEEDVLDIHSRMKEVVSQCGGLIDAVYFCAAIEAEAPCRKPNIGMAESAKKDYPSINFSKSIMVGNNPSDMQFGKTAGMYTVLLTTTRQANTVEAKLVDFVFDDLNAFAKALL